MKTPALMSNLFAIVPGGGAAVSWAQAAADSSTAGGAVNNANYLWQVMFGLLIVLLIIFAIAWLVRRFGAGGLLQNSDMQVLSSLPLSARERIVLVDVGGRQMLLGVAPGSVSALHVFDEPVVSRKQGQELSDFGRKVRDIMHKGRVN